MREPDSPERSSRNAQARGTDRTRSRWNRPTSTESSRPRARCRRPPAPHPPRHRPPAPPPPLHHTSLYVSQGHPFELATPAHTPRVHRPHRSQTISTCQRQNRAVTTALTTRQYGDAAQPQRKEMPDANLATPRLPPATCHRIGHCLIGDHLVNRRAHVKWIPTRKTHALRLFRGPFPPPPLDPHAPAQSGAKYQEKPRSHYLTRPANSNRKVTKIIAVQRNTRYHGRIHNEPQSHETSEGRPR
ncbi:hypothetical protein DFR67_11617 [Williamsia limnetica]|uniref:Uncharacterized protein n=1 Tax=Williamsia limnetica TaxID=882452 RepID=A0A318RBT7_WILLI|nr:hypothetical protein DFR67_11617 [Williamsia limnetica]